jgi:hypothetical protein
MNHHVCQVVFGDNRLGVNEATGSVSSAAVVSHHFYHVHHKDLAAIIMIRAVLLAIFVIAVWSGVRRGRQLFSNHPGSDIISVTGTLFMIRWRRTTMLLKQEEEDDDEIEAKRAQIMVVVMPPLVTHSLTV